MSNLKPYNITAKGVSNISPFEIHHYFRNNNLVYDFLLICGLILLSINVFGQKMQLNDQEYFEAQGINVLVFSNQYNGMFFDEKTAGIELIHHGVRTSTGGAVRLQNTPEQWDLIPVMVERKADKINNVVEVSLRYKEFDFDSKVTVTTKDEGFLIRVYLDKPVPADLEGKAGFNLEFLPASYMEKAYLADGKPGSFPTYPSGTTLMEPATRKIPQFAGHTTFDDRGKGDFIVPTALAKGKSIVLAPEDPGRTVRIQSDLDIMLFDGRNLAQNGWFVVRSLFPAGKTGKVLEWYVEPNTVTDWKRPPVIGFSQVGYLPGQEKIAVIELDKLDIPLKQASLCRITMDGEILEQYTGEITPWGKFLRYNYVKFDFSTVTEPGLYFIRYGEHKTNTFPIDPGIYRNIWHPTLDVWFPVQMDHMQVNEAYRVWHGVPYLDDALQAPVNHEHFDGYSMGPSTDTKYKPFERIPGLDVGGWFDAGDFDIQTASHNSVILSLASTWENFMPDRDQTFIDQANRFVDIHRPDGKPDIIQQLEHGTLNVLAQVKNIGHPVRGIVVPNLHQYHHLGDASTETDNLPYNPDLKPFETDGKSSGTMDDRWVFSNRSPRLDYHTIAALAASSRALRDHSPALAGDCLKEAKRLWDENKALTPETDTVRARFLSSIEMTAALQLFITTREKEYLNRFHEILWPGLDRAVGMTIGAALQAYPYMDPEMQNRLKPYVIKYKEINDGYGKNNPYGVPVTLGGWGGNGTVINWAVTNYFAHKYFPEIIGPEYVFKGLNYIFGCHPYSNISFVSTAGTVSKKITYGNNRADFTFIAGGVVPGLILLKPDFLENKEDWPFLWGENECVIDTGAAYILLSNAANELSN